MVTVVAWLEAWFSDAVTVVDAPSAIEALPSASVNVGVLSSSSSVSVSPETVPMPWLFCAVPVIGVVRFGSSVVLPTAVMVTESLLLVVSPADMVMVLSASTV